MRGIRTTSVAIGLVAAAVLLLAVLRPWEGSADSASTREADRQIFATTNDDEAGEPDGQIFETIDDEVAGVTELADGTDEAATDTALGTSEADPSEADPSEANLSDASALQGDEDAAQTETDDAGEVTLTLLHNNDGESKLLADPDAGFPGIARFAQTWIDLGTSTSADILLRVSAGDSFLASKELSAGLALEDGPLYDAVALRGLYEAMAFGNHEFDFGPDVTARFIEDMRQGDGSIAAPFLAANVDVSGEPGLADLADEGVITPSMIYEDPVTRQQIGVIGALTPRLANISSPQSVTVGPDIAAAVNAEVAAIVDQGVNRIVLISHLQGLGQDRLLIPQLSGVDIVVAGGGDELLKNDDDTCLAEEDAADPYPLLVADADDSDVLVVTAPGGYRCIGRLDVTFDVDGRVADATGTSIGVPLDGPQEPFSLSQVEEPLLDAVQQLEANVIADAQTVLNGTRADLRTGQTNLGALMADAILAATQNAGDFGALPADVALQNAGGIRNDAGIGPGPITEADTFDIAPFANFVVSGEISRQQFKDVLEVAVADLPEASGAFAQVAGLSMSVDLSAPGRVVDADGDCSVVDSAGERIRNVMLNDGTVIVADGDVIPGDDLVLATIDFLAGGGDCYPLTDLEFTKVGVSYQQALQNFIVDELDGTISVTDYPIFDIRIVIDDAQSNASESTADLQVEDDPQSAADTADEASEGAADEGETSDATGETSPDLATDPEELPRTGVETWRNLIIAITVTLGGLLILREAQRAGLVSLTNRLVATGAWFPERHASDIGDTVSSDGDRSGAND